jgi:uncharacterized protein with HEPN domain
MDRDRVYLRDILGAATAAQEYLLGLDRETFLSLREKQDAVIRSLEVVGEAVRRLSDQTKAAMPEIPWEKFRGMRNILIHQYDNVDLDLVYDTVNQDLPLLERTIRIFLDRMEKGTAP